MHPRVRGAGSRSSARQRVIAGASLRLRGRLLPRTPEPVHPRVRGADGWRPRVGRVTRGASPHVRGPGRRRSYVGASWPPPLARPFCGCLWCIPACAGFTAIGTMGTRCIPARAGPTIRYRPARIISPLHPRRRGPCGRVAQYGLQGPRHIPAHAGSTSNYSNTGVLAWFIPAPAGQRCTSLARPAGDLGASPPARG